MKTIMAHVFIFKQDYADIPILLEFMLPERHLRKNGRNLKYLGTCIQVAISLIFIELHQRTLTSSEGQTFHLSNVINISYINVAGTIVCLIK